MSNKTNKTIESFKAGNWQDFLTESYEFNVSVLGEEIANYMEDLKKHMEQLRALSESAGVLSGIDPNRRSGAV